MSLLTFNNVIIKMHTTTASRIRLITFFMTVGLSSTELITLNEYILGGLILPSHESTWEMENHVGSNLSFLKRLWNFVTLCRFLHYLCNQVFLINQQLAEKHLGPLPALIDILKNNTSMVFINRATAITPARPQPPNIISFTSFHIQDELLPLSKVFI